MRAIALLILMLSVGSPVLGQSNRSSSSSSSSDSSPDFPCVADARWTNSNGAVSYSRSAQLPVSLSLLVHLGKTPQCANAEVTVTATYLTDTQDFICSGAIPAATPPPMIAISTVQNFNLEVRPFTQNDFLRWRNAPGARGIQQGKRLLCMNLDGTAEVLDSDRAKATWIRLSVAVLPPGGGLAITEAMLHVQP